VFERSAIKKNLNYIQYDFEETILRIRLVDKSAKPFGVFLQEKDQMHAVFKVYTTSQTSSVIESSNVVKWRDEKESMRDCNVIYRM
jgi:hypothetical protein